MKGGRKFCHSSDLRRDYSQQRAAFEMFVPLRINSQPKGLPAAGAERTQCISIKADSAFQFVGFWPPTNPHRRKAKSSVKHLPLARGQSEMKLGVRVIDGTC